MTAGLMVGVVIGAVYVASVRRSLANGLAARGKRGVRLVQFSSLMRLLFTFAALDLAQRLIPGMSAAWALAAAIAVSAAFVVGTARRGVHA